MEEFDAGYETYGRRVSLRFKYIPDLENVEVIVVDDASDCKVGEAE